MFKCFTNIFIRHIFIFIILFGLGNGLKNSFKEFFLDDATNILYVESGKTSKPFKGYKASRRIEFENEDLYDIQKFFSFYLVIFSVFLSNNL